ncbi:TQXA domain-containing protein [Herbihabitans rhizosphaerae]|uniref:TQXA domain-containing protein n=1 Tax=Herbihabitans rhizosphaerae TaxID=1872711 RepID=A0A4Q7L5S0_9PSEU|nr:thioester domain-containing protein [Herbihabitans rhizosphaerae]RZS44998.1 TQXA domain-containing protein [Herbihabitans rhizosphaerae]
MASRSTLVRAGAAVVGASIITMLTALPASAQTTGKLDPSGNVDGLRVNLKGGPQNITTKLIGLKSGDAKLSTYCVELHVTIDPKFPDFNEVGWDAYPQGESPFHKNRAKVNWVLHHSYPAVELDKLSTTTTKAGLQFKDGLSKEEAISATQAAVWHFSDQANLDTANPTPGNADAKDDVNKLYGFLTGKDNVGIGDQPTPALKISPESLSGEAGKKVGPFKVSTTADAVELTKQLPEGVKVVDTAGKELAAKDIKNGSEIFFDVPSATAAGEGSFKLDASAKLTAGRLFIGKDYQQHPTQSLILAKADNTKLSDEAKVSWKAAAPVPTSPKPSVPVKIPAGDAQAAPAESGGGNAPLLVGLGVLALGAAGGVFALQRRRNHG